jgi:hypothetical protein
VRFQKPETTGPQLKKTAASNNVITGIITYVRTMTQRNSATVSILIYASLTATAQHESEIAPGLLTVEIEPLDHDDLDKWYREEHLDMLAQLPDYRRSVRHTIGPKTDRTLQTAPMWLASHDFEFWDGFSMELGDAVSSTPWTLKVITSSPVFVLRSWELVYSVGFRNSST